MKFTLTISAAVMALLTLATAAPTAEQSAPAANVLVSNPLPTHRLFRAPLV